jgi:hypothetical protein
MKDLLPFVKSYVKNSFSALEELKQMNIPDNALLFSADATSMYTNIDTPTGNTAVRDFIENYKNQIPDYVGYGNREMPTDEA